jgi:hypothetical protein
MAIFEERNGKLFIDGKEVLRGWESFTGWYWFATEIVQTQNSVIGGKVYENDTIYFGLVQGEYEEWGDFSEAELKSLAPRIWEIPAKNLPYSGRRKEAGASPPISEQAAKRSTDDEEFIRLHQEALAFSKELKEAAKTSPEKAMTMLVEVLLGVEAIRADIEASNWKAFSEKQHQNGKTERSNRERRREAQVSQPTR